VIGRIDKLLEHWLSMIRFPQNRKREDSLRIKEAFFKLKGSQTVPFKKANPTHARKSF